MPDVIADLGPVEYIDQSPIDPSRDLANIPTVGLAYYHYWIFFMELQRAQRQYAACIAEKGAYQSLLGEMPDDHFLSPKYLITISVREYDVPFRAETTTSPWRPPVKSDLLRHVVTAAGSVNTAVFWRKICEGETAIIRARVIQNKKTIR